MRCNAASPEAVYFGHNDAVNATDGVKLEVGESVPIPTTAAIYFFSAAGTGKVSCVETFD
jgi:hypothetical protein